MQVGGNKNTVDHILPQIVLTKGYIRQTVFICVISVVKYVSLKKVFVFVCMRVTMSLFPPYSFIMSLLPTNFDQGNMQEGPLYCM